MAHLRREFETERSAYVAADLLSALVSNAAPQAEVESVASFILEIPAVESSIADFASAALMPRGPRTGAALSGQSSIEVAARSDVATLRRVLENQPRNAVRRVDLALAHTILGNRAEAKRQMLTALQLAPNNRFVIRSGVRFLIHDEDFDQALAVVRRSPLTMTDPWLLATAMAAAQLAEQPLTETRTARELLSVGHFGPHDLAELGGELATVEMHAGHTKVARKLFEQALVQPNENTVAQAAWAADRGGFALRQETLSIDRGFEARARSSARAGEWDLATKE